MILSLLLLAACGNNKGNEEMPENDQQEETEATDPVLDSLNSLIFSNPEDPDHFTSRARHFANTGNPVAAMNDIDRALRADSTFAPAYHLKGNLHFSQQDYNAAYEAYNNCITYDPNHQDGLLDAAYMESLLGNYAAAITNINTALRNDQYIPRAYYMKGQIYKQSGDTALAVSSYQTASELDPENYDAFLALALLYSDTGDDLAEEYFNTALSIDPENPEALYGKAMYYQENADGDTAMLNKAFPIYQQILEVDPGNAAAAYNQGYIYLEYLSADNDSAYAKAADWFSEAIEIYPMYYQALYNRGLSFESMDMKDRAAKDYRKALAIQSDYEPAARALERVLYGE